MTTQLRDDSTVEDPRLNRLVEFDEKSRQFPVRTALPERPTLKTQTWAAGAILNQLKEGSCVGNAFAKDAASLPVAVPNITEGSAVTLYRLAQKLDEFPDDTPYEGTSTLGGAKAYVKMGYARGYKWAFSIDDVLQTLSNLGPVVIGINWHESMYETRKNGFVNVEGRVVGGHCICLTGLHLHKRLIGETRRRDVLVEWTNSWGRSYGVGGKGFILPATLEQLLKDQGDACVPTGRKQPPSV